MNIGFDLDKIFIDYPPFLPAALIERLYRKKSNGELAYRIPSGIEQKIRQISHYHKLRPPITNNINYMRTLVTTNKRHTYYLISSRFGFLDKQTKTVIEKYKIKELFKKSFFNNKNEQPHVFKDRMIKELDIALYVDDDLLLLKYLCVTNPKTQFYWLNGKKNGGISKNVTAITDIGQIKL